MGRTWLRLVAFLAVSAIAGGSSAQSHGATGNLRDVLDRAGAYVERYFARAQSLVCRETVTVQFLGRDLSPDSSTTRRLEYDTRIAWEATPEGGDPQPTAHRQLTRIGGRAPRPRDKPKCMEPKETEPRVDPLAILLPGNQDDFIFALDGRARIRERDAVRVTYRPREVGPITLTPQEEKGCWTITFPGYERGRFWVDAETSGILRHDTWLSGILEARSPRQRDRDEAYHAIERMDTSTTYRAVPFGDPEELLMLPRTVDYLQVTRTGSNVRIRHEFSAYRRFLTSGRIVQE